MKFRIHGSNILLALVMAVTAAAGGLPSRAVAAVPGRLAPAAESLAVFCGGLYFSEYIEGSSFNKAVEIFNGTGAPVDLSGFKLELYSNGSLTISQSMTLAGSVAHGDAFVVANPNASAAILAVADMTSSTVINYNGNDAFVLRKISDGSLVDVIGQIGFDPGSEWGTGLTSTMDNTLRRKGTVTVGDGIGTDTFDPSIEWDGYAVNTFDGLGWHVAACGEIAPTVTSTTPTAGTVGVASDANLYVNFYEPVTVSAASFLIVCQHSGTHAAELTGGPMSYTLNPTVDFESNERCSVTVQAEQVSDQDPYDPPDAMVADYIFAFDVADPAPTVTTVSPANNAYGVRLDANLSVNFSESVDVADGWYSISCTLSGSHTAVVSGGPTSFSLNPAVDFQTAETCTVTLESTLITDRDSSDPYDQMAQDYTWSFAITTCGLPATFIHEIQGTGDTSPLVSQALTIEGTVVGDFQNNGQMGGFFVQEEDGDNDADPSTSEGVYVYNTSFPVSVGSVVRLTGTVVEFINTSYGQMARMTEISPVTKLEVCSTGNPLPNPAVIDLPDTADISFTLEKFEGMRVSLPETLTVQQNYFQGRFGQLTLGAGGRIFQMNNFSKGGGSLSEFTRMLVLDDGSTTQNLDAMSYYPSYGALRAGDTTAGLVGVLDQGRINSTNSTSATSFPDIYYRLHPTAAPVFTQVNPRPAVSPETGGRLKVAGVNVLNYFTTIDCGNPDADCSYDPTSGYVTSNTPRGADTLTEFTRQQDKIVRALAAQGADVFGLTEIESWDGAFAPQALVNALNMYLVSQGSSDVYAAVADPANGYFQVVDGGDYIQSTLIYKTNKVAPVGSSLSTDNTIFSRSPFAQEFKEIASGEQFVVVVNHLKSKGSCPLDGSLNDDQGDGQGCWNALRVEQAEALATFITTDLIPLDEDVLVIGDLNAYGAEDPVTTLTAAGLINQVAAYVPAADRYTYVFDGAAGYLDHALSTATFNPQVTGVALWHINADEPSVIDYNTEYKDPLTSPSSPDFYQLDPFRSSDHDAVIIGLDLANTENDPPVVAAPIADQLAYAGWPYSFTFAENTFTDLDLVFGDVLTYTAALADGSALPAWLTFDPLTRTFSGTPVIGDLDKPTIKVTAQDKDGGTAFDLFDLQVLMMTHMPIICK